MSKTLKLSRHLASKNGLTRHIEKTANRARRKTVSKLKTRVRQELRGKTNISTRNLNKRIKHNLGKGRVWVGANDVPLDWVKKLKGSTKQGDPSIDGYPDSFSFIGKRRSLIRSPIAMQRIRTPPYSSKDKFYRSKRGVQKRIPHTKTGLARIQIPIEEEVNETVKSHAAKARTLYVQELRSAFKS